MGKHYDLSRILQIINCAYIILGCQHTKNFMLMVVFCDVLILRIWARYWGCSFVAYLYNPHLGVGCTRCAYLQRVYSQYPPTLIVDFFFFFLISVGCCCYFKTTFFAVFLPQPKWSKKLEYSWFFHGHHCPSFLYSRPGRLLNKRVSSRNRSQLVYSSC